MNERIRELAVQAGWDIKPIYKGEDDYKIPHYRGEKLEKFAELIVRDVVEQIITLEMTDGEWYQYDIFKHFGVE